MEMGGKKTHKCMILWALSCLIAVILPAAADKKPVPPEGTTDEELKKLTLPAPAQTKVAIMPYGDFADDMKRRRVASAYNFLLFEHEGFQMVPLLESYRAAAEDKEIEPGEGIRRTDAVRIGKKLGVKWAVYGEIKGMRAYDKQGWFNNKRKSEIALRTTIVDCETAEIVYWRTVTSTEDDVKAWGGTRPDKLTRQAIQLSSRKIVAPLFAALPAHETVANIKGENAKHVPDDGDVLALVNKLWPADEKDNAKEKK